MILNRRVAIVLPAYNAAKTVERACAEIPHDVVDDVILIDDASTDATTAIVRSRGLHVIKHGRNRGYGGNQRRSSVAPTFVVMLHLGLSVHSEAGNGDGVDGRLATV